jgi:gliding motility-associated protein GldC
MKKSKIQFEVELDEQNIPENIYWHATDKEDDGLDQTKSISIALWDHFNKNTMRIDLWTKDMPLDEQKRFYVDCIGGLAQSILSATGDEFMSGEMNKLCETFIRHIQEEQKKQQEQQQKK